MNYDGEEIMEAILVIPKNWKLSSFLYTDIKNFTMHLKTGTGHFCIILKEKAFILICFIIRSLNHIIKQIARNLWKT